MSMDTDRENRRKITEVTDSSYFVEAGAGSGKTRNLVERMVAMVKQGIDIRQICAITFTKAAAREFYGRFQKMLSKESVRETDETKRLNCEKALRSIDLCFMGTIDSFSELILREHPLEAGIPSDFTVCTQKDMFSVYRREYAEILKGGYGADMKKKAELFEKLFRDPADTFLNGYMALSDRRDSAFVYDPPVTDDIDAYFSGVKDDVLQLYGKIYENRDCVYIQKSKTAANKFLDELDAMRKDYDRLKGSWSRLLPSVEKFFKDKHGIKITKDPAALGIRRADVFSMKNVKTAKTDVYTPDATALGFKEQLDRLKYAAAMDLIVSAMERITGRLTEAGELTFYECKILLRDMLKRDAAEGGSLIRHIAGRHSYFMLDEFQDTDPVQAEIFFYLSAAEPVPDWRQCVPRPGSLFIVGDPKQSIYRFRNADIKSYNGVRELFGGFGGVLELTRNFRSTDTLKRSFNKIFSELLPEDTEDQSRFREIPIDSDGYDTSCSGIYTYSTDKTSDPVNICRIITSMMDDPSFTVFDKEEGTERRMRFGDFMVITKAKDEITDIMAEMSRRNIPCFVEGSTLFGKCPSLVTAALMLKAAADPDDQQAVYAALKQGTYHITDRELAQARPKFSLYSKPEDITGSERVRDAFGQLIRLRKKACTMRFSALFGYVINELRLPGSTDDDELECLYFAKELIRAGEKNGSITTASEGAEFLAKLIASGEQERSLSFEKQPDKVHLANLHKVKGLEKPVVILANAKAGSFGAGIRTEYGGSGSRTYVFSCSKKEGKQWIRLFSTADNSEKAQREMLSSEAEGDRLVYVAATRAMQVLIVAQPENSYWSSIISEASGDVFDRLDSENEDKVIGRESVSAEQLYDSAVCVTADKTPKEPGYTIVLPSKAKEKGSVSADSSDAAEDSALLTPEVADDTAGDDERSEPKEQVRRQFNSAFAGTLVHRLMECLVTSHGSFGRDELIRYITESFEAGEVYKEILEKVYDRITDGGYGQTNGMPSDILAELADAECWCEVPFCYERENNEVVNGVIDLLYRKNGRWRVVDYKTNQEIEELETIYHGQLAEYERAMLELTGEKVEAMIYHIDI